MFCFIDLQNIHQELSKLLSKKKAEDEKQKEMYRRMIGADKEPTPTPPEKATNWVRKYVTVNQFVVTSSNRSVHFADDSISFKL
jgi:hypothetical protein